MFTDALQNPALDGLFDPQVLAAQWTESHREAADRVLDLYQNAVGRLADAHVTTARAVDVPAVVTLAESQATLGREVADAYVRSVRRLLEP